MKPAIKPSTMQELLARELHRQYRAAAKAMGVRGPQAHDHGVRDCGQVKFKYFYKRAALMLTRAKGHKQFNTLGDALDACNAVILTHCVRLGIDAEEYAVKSRTS